MKGDTKYYLNILCSFIIRWIAGLNNKLVNFPCVEMEADPPGSVFSSISYIIGASNFLVGSIAFIPQYYETETGQYVGGIAYTFGSFCFCIADLVILYLLVTHKFPFFDRIGLLIGSLMYVVGSSLFIPDIMRS